MSDARTAVTTPWRIFRYDLRTSLDVLVRRPALPLVSLGVACAVVVVPDRAYSGHGLAPLLYVVMAGWFGTQRVWFMRGFADEPIRPSELIRLTISFVPRFAVLGFLVWLPTALAVWLLAIVWPDPRTLLTAWFVFPLVLALATDVALTFVTPALTYSTRRVSRALVLGLRVLRHDWPATAWYALVPPLAVTLMVRVLPQSAVSLGTSETLAVIAMLIGLWFKGATAAYFLRTQTSR